MGGADILRETSGAPVVDRALLDGSLSVAALGRSPTAFSIDGDNFVLLPALRGRGRWCDCLKWTTTGGGVGEGAKGATSAETVSSGKAAGCRAKETDD